MKFCSFLVSISFLISCSSGSKKTLHENEPKNNVNDTAVVQQEKRTQVTTVFNKMNTKIVVEDLNGNYELQMVKKEESTSLNGHKAKDGLKYVSIQIEVTNPSTEERSPEIPDFFLYTTAEGKLEHKGYQRTPKPNCKEPFFEFPLLGPGKSYTGWKTFEIPKDSNNLYLGYKTAMFTGDFIYFDLN